MPDELGMTHPLTQVVRAGIVVAVLGALLCVVGCGDTRPRTELEAKQEYAQRIVKGGSAGMADISAAGFDPATLDLLDVEIYDGQRTIRARRAEILISRELDTVSLRLVDVVAADPTPGVERVVAMESLTTDPVRLGYRVLD